MTRQKYLYTHIYSVPYVISNEKGKTSKRNSLFFLRVSTITFKYESTKICSSNKCVGGGTWLLRSLSIKSFSFSLFFIRKNILQIAICSVKTECNRNGVVNFFVLFLVSISVSIFLLRYLLALRDFYIEKNSNNEWCRTRRKKYEKYKLPKVCYKSTRISFFFSNKRYVFLPFALTLIISIYFVELLEWY